MDISWITALTALVAVITTPVIAIYVVKKQTAATVLSTNRQNWINTLRDSLSEYIGLMTTFNIARSEKLLNTEGALLKAEKILTIESKIKLMLNTKEEDHKKLEDFLENARVKVIGISEEHWNHEEWNNIYHQIFPLCQSILKREWERVKKTQ